MQDRNMENLEKSITDQIKQLLISSRNNVVQTVNTAMVYTYYEIGKLLVEKIQKGQERAKYGKNLLRTVSENLSKEFGKGYSVQNLENMRLFYVVYSGCKTKSQTLSRKLGIVENSSTLSRKSYNDMKFTLSWEMRITPLV